MTDNVYCLVKIIEKDERIIAAVQFEIKLFDFFYHSKQLTDYIYTDIYCKLSKCIGQTPCLYEHYLVFLFFPREISELRRPIAAKFCTMLGSVFNFIIPGQNFGMASAKKF